MLKNYVDMALFLKDRTTCLIVYHAQKGWKIMGKGGKEDQ